MASAPEGDLARTSVDVIESLAVLFKGEPPTLAGIDMTIGLPEHVGPQGRVPERLIRQVLGTRRSSVFSTPCRAAVYAETYPDACAAARANSDPPRAISKQSFNIFPKMREIDGLLNDQPHLRPLLREVHPETTFCVLNGGTPLSCGKKTADGRAERMAILSRFGVPHVAMTARLRGAAADDVIDALAALVSTWRVSRGEARVFGEAGDIDAFGFPSAISA